MPPKNTLSKTQAPQAVAPAATAAASSPPPEPAPLANPRAEEAAALVAAFLKVAKRHSHKRENLALEQGLSILNAGHEVQIAIVIDVVERVAEVAAGLRDHSSRNGAYANLRYNPQFPEPALLVLERLLRRKLPFTEEQLIHLAARTAELEVQSTWNTPYMNGLVSAWEERVRECGYPPALQDQLQRIERALRLNVTSAELKLADRIADLNHAQEVLPKLSPGEAWSDKAIADLEAMPPPTRAAWNALLVHCQNTSGSAPSGKWTNAGRAAIDKIGADEFRARVLAWFPLVDKPRTIPIENWPQYTHDPNPMIIEPHAELLKGLAWLCGLNENADTARALGALAVSAYKKIPGIGPRAVKIGNACVNALGAMPGTTGVAQLAILKAKVKFIPAQKGVAKALAVAAERAGVPPSEIEELATPTFGFQEIGLRRETLGDFTAELAVVGSTSVELRWLRADGKPQKTLPAAVKEQHADELKELKAAAKDAQNILGALRERLDALFLQTRSWPVAAWRERVADHPLMGSLARRLIWECEARGETRAFMFVRGAVVDASDHPLDPPADGVIRIWHPIGRPIEEVMAWRELLERHEIQQPFKQAHREIYLLTDAERRTETYSNRFASHILRQHQFNALCGLRGWRNSLRIMADINHAPPTRALPEWNLRAEFWVEAVGAAWGEDTNDAGAFLRIATDQVRFYPIEAGQNFGRAYGGGYHLRAGDPVPLERIPPLVLSEIMRDVDLFVGVASVGNDPTWADGGPHGRHLEYWRSYSSGELEGSALSRKEILERLVPRLRIAARCSFEDRFLIVRGDLRTYKIHLGSGNIFMEPDSQYLCIVKTQARDQAEAGKVFLPFEGDGVLSVILSKAFMLAHDTAITDPTITRQIGRR